MGLMTATCLPFSVTTRVAVRARSLLGRVSSTSFWKVKMYGPATAVAPAFCGIFAAYVDTNIVDPIRPIRMTPMPMCVM